VQVSKLSRQPLLGSDSETCIKLRVVYLIFVRHNGGSYDLPLSP